MRGGLQRPSCGSSGRRAASIPGMRPKARKASRSSCPAPPLIAGSTTFEPKAAIVHSASLLADLRSEFGNVGLAAAPYNAGASGRTWLNDVSNRLRASSPAATRGAWKLADPRALKTPGRGCGGIMPQARGARGVRDRALRHSERCVAAFAGRVEVLVLRRGLCLHSRDCSGAMPRCCRNAEPPCCPSAILPAGAARSTWCRSAEVPATTPSSFAPFRARGGACIVQNYKAQGWASVARSLKGAFHFDETYDQGDIRFSAGLWCRRLKFALKRWVMLPTRPGRVR